MITFCEHWLLSVHFDQCVSAVTRPGVQQTETKPQVTQTGHRGRTYLLVSWFSDCEQLSVKTQLSLLVKKNQQKSEKQHLRSFEETIKKRFQPTGFNVLQS